nr:hypothetical protein [Providencia sp. G1(2023)]
MALGLKNREIAKLFFISEETVKEGYIAIFFEGPIVCRTPLLLLLILCTELKIVTP